jgi:pimeloyl-ACP methyl ester carboxylesterase
MPRSTPKPRNPNPAPPEVVSPIWLLKAIGFTILAALLCGYLTLCLLFYQGQWQLVLHPTRNTASPTSIAGIPYQLVHFGPDESATPQLTGWWIPAGPNGRYAQTTLLFLPGATGSLADSIPLLANLHTLGINIFAFDYRGYGQSAPTHPSQANMIHDTEAAWQYLTHSRAIPSRQIIPYGIDIGASLATHLAATYPTIPAIILDSPHVDLLDTALQDPRAKLLPVRLLFHERFPLAAPLSTLSTPKLLLSRSNTSAPAFLTAASPKLTVELSSPSAALDDQSILRFLDQYLPPPSIPALVPTPAPVR